MGPISTRNSDQSRVETCFNTCLFGLVSKCVRLLLLATYLFGTGDGSTPCHDTALANDVAHYQNGTHRCKIMLTVGGRRIATNGLRTRSTLALSATLAATDLSITRSLSAPGRGGPKRTRVRKVLPAAAHKHFPREGPETTLWVG